MATITFKGNPIHTVGELPAIGSRAADFLLVNGELQNVTLDSFKGKKKILNIVPSLDTGVCAASARRFNQEAVQFPNTVILTISRDLPFAQKRFCTTEGIDRVITLSDLRNRDFGKAYGVEIIDGPLAGLLSRAVIVLDEENRVIYTEQVPEIAQEPNYEAVIRLLKGA